MTPSKLKDMRRDYDDSPFDTNSAPADPMLLFNHWLEQACSHQAIVEPNAMHLATVDEQGRPSARMVLLKGIDNRAFVFYTNYQSRKGRQLAANPHACLTFWWEPLVRQVRIEGVVRKLSDETSNDYFASRDRNSQLGAWASPQSQPIKAYDELLQSFQQAQDKFTDTAVPRPANWGGYALTAERIEFWQGQKSRLHSRLLYIKDQDQDGWEKQCLAP